jgi:hypothetical protein
MDGMGSFLRDTRPFRLRFLDPVMPHLRKNHFSRGALSQVITVTGAEITAPFTDSFSPERSSRNSNGQSNYDFALAKRVRNFMKYVTDQAFYRLLRKFLYGPHQLKPPI